MGIERNDYMDGKADAEGRRPRRVEASAAYEAGFLDGVASRSEYTRPVAFSGITIQGMIMEAKATDGSVFEWSVSDQVGSQIITGSAPDLEMSITAMEGVLRSQGRSIARRTEIERTVRTLHTTASAEDVQRLTNKVVDRLLSKGN